VHWPRVACSTHSPCNFQRQVAKTVKAGPDINIRVALAMSVHFTVHALQAMNLVDIEVTPSVVMDLTSEQLFRFLARVLLRFIQQGDARHVEAVCNVRQLTSAVAELWSTFHHTERAVAGIVRPIFWPAAGTPDPHQWYHVFARAGIQALPEVRKLFFKCVTFAVGTDNAVFRVRVGQLLSSLGAARGGGLQNSGQRATPYEHAPQQEGCLMAGDPRGGTSRAAQRAAERQGGVWDA